MNPACKKTDILRLLAAGLATAYLLATLAAGVRNLGSLVLAGLCLLLWGRWLTARGLGPHRLRRGIKWLCRLSWGLCLGCCAILYAATLANTLPANAEPAVIVVPGAQINGSLPSQMLQNRLDAAFEVWQDHPGSLFVVTGGQAGDDPYTEADVMAMYLYHRGVDADDIYPEHNAANTQENFRFAAQIIRQNKLEGPVVVATDSFHQTRCRLWAGRCGLQEVYCAPCRPCWGIAPVFWLRELCGVAYTLLFC